MALKHVVFDLDDTLIPSTLGYAYALKKLSIVPSEYKAARDEVKKTIGDSHTSAHHRLLYFKRMLERSGRMNPSHALGLLASYETHLMAYLRSAWIKLRRDQLLKDLKRRGLQLSIITNETTRTQLLKMKTIDPSARYFDCIITSEEVGEEKPSPRIFEALIRRAKIKKTGQAVLIGDSWKCDIEPALDFGFLPLLSIEFSTPDPTQDLWVETIETLDQIRYRL